MSPARLVTVSALLALAGCAPVGPDYHVPDEAVVNRGTANTPLRQQTADPGLFTQAEAPSQWWRLYHDPQLDALIQQALRANADLREAQAHLEAAQAISEQARSKQELEAGVKANPFYGHPAGMQYLQPNLVLPNDWMYSAGGGISYQVDLFGQIRRAIEAAEADTQAAQAALDSARITVAAETARAYASLCSAGMQLKAAHHSVEVQKDSLKAVQTLASHGRGTALDVTRAQAQLSQLEAAAPPFLARQRTALYTLAALTGRTPAEMPSNLLACSTLPHLAQPIPVGDGAALLKRRPDVRQAERALAAATARIGVATAELYPKISLGLDGTSLGLASMLTQGSTLGWSLGPLISWSIPNEGTHARIALTQAQAKEALAHFDAVVLKSLKETESALAIYARELDRDEALEAAHHHSEQAAHEARQLFAAGKIDYLAMLDTERTLASAESSLAASQAELAANQIAVFLALGGGWETAPTPP
jgi:NodT family efflux transporter outer membrane factor (OMF) lipoprotein